MFNFSKNLFASPLEQFEITWLSGFSNINVMLLILSFFGFLCFLKISNGNFLLKGYQTIILTLYEASYNLVKSNINKNGNFFFGQIFTLLSLILLINVLGIIPYGFTLTSQLDIALYLAITVYVGLNIIGIQIHKLKFFGLLFPSGASLALVPLLVPIESVSYIFRVISLPVRLFANMMAGHTLLKVIVGFVWAISKSSVITYFLLFLPWILVVILFALETAVAAIQAYVFCILSTIYINDAISLH